MLNKARVSAFSGAERLTAQRGQIQTRVGSRPPESLPAAKVGNGGPRARSRGFPRTAPTPDVDTKRDSERSSRPVCAF